MFKPFVDQSEAVIIGLLGATKHLFKRVCRSVCPFVSWSIRPSVQRSVLPSVGPSETPSQFSLKTAFPDMDNYQTAFLTSTSVAAAATAAPTTSAAATATSAATKVDMGSSKKSCAKGILESCGLPGEKKSFCNGILGQRAISVQIFKIFGWHQNHGYET